MRALLSGVGLALVIPPLAAPAATAQRAPATYLSPADRDQVFFENWFGAEFRSAGLRPLWTDKGLEGYRARYRLAFAAGSAGVTIVTIDVEQDGSGVVTSHRMRPGGIIEIGQRAHYIPGKLAWADRREVTGAPIRRLQRMFQAEDFFRQSFRGDEKPLEPTWCNDGVGYLIEMRDGSGYNAITRNNCDVENAHTLVDAVMKLSGGWPRR
jgi:hypothetical protein